MTESCSLAKKSCIPCKGDVPPLAEDEQRKLLQELEGWEIINGHHLEKEFKFKNFKKALDWVNKLGAIAEEEGHHPDILLRWGSVTVQIWTHAIDGLRESDFVLAAKADQIIK